MSRAVRLNDALRFLVISVEAGKEFPDAEESARRLYRLTDAEAAEVKGRYDAGDRGQS